MAKKRKARRGWKTYRDLDGDGKQWYFGSDFKKKREAESWANTMRKRNFNARVIPGHGGYGVYVLYKLSENAIEIGNELKYHRQGRYKGAEYGSTMKSTFPGSEEDVIKAVKDLQKENQIEKVEPKNDIEPLYKLTNKGKKTFGYDPEAWD